MVSGWFATFMGPNKAGDGPVEEGASCACIHWPVSVVGEGLHTQVQPMQLHIPHGQDPHCGNY